MQFELRNVSCGYRAAAPVVKNLSLSLQSGDICCILGPNGVGKTTLFRTMLKLIPPLTGRVIVDGEDISGWKPQRLAQSLAYVAQAHTLDLPYRVREVAMMGRLGRLGPMARPGLRDHEIVEQALEDVGIRRLRDALYTELSGGERQLLMIARALCQQPRLLVMDEPTASLDYGNMISVMETIRRQAAAGLCVVFTSHMPDQAFMCRAKTALLLRGSPPVFGGCDEVITEKNLFEAYHTKIQILEVIGADGTPLKAVVPRITEENA